MYGKKTTIAIIERAMKGDISPDLAARKILVLFGEMKNEHCYIDRKPEECCIYKHATHDCKNACGHFIK